MFSKDQRVLKKDFEILKEDLEALKEDLEVFRKDQGLSRREWKQHSPPSEKLMRCAFTHNRYLNLLFMGFLCESNSCLPQAGELIFPTKARGSASLSLYAVGNEEPNYLNYQYE